MALAFRFIEYAEKALERVEDPGLLAIAYAVLETGYDIDNVRSAIESA
ncbi:hypothetical protein J7I98_39390 [Streptomyces sp. ISL-98]|nr:hypothetical protein [Streptomyces sp. ISL-98]MBT2511735.1 hypothetical protein [Streptomyces sp. ISL-98]